VVIPLSFINKFYSKQDTLQADCHEQPLVKSFIGINVGSSLQSIVKALIQCLLINVLISQIIPPRNPETPKIKKIVLLGCGPATVQAIAFKIHPRIISPIENIICLFRVIF